MAEEEKDRSEPATPFKLEEARRRGQVAKSVDFNSLFVVGALVAVIYGWADGLTRTAARLGALLLERSPQVVENPVLWPWLSAVLTQTLVMIAPFFAVALVAAVLANLVQTGVTLTAFPLKPDFQRLNPVNGFKRLFSLRTLYESAKTVVKFIALSVVAYLAIAALLPALFGIQQGDPRTYMPLLLDHAASLLFKLLLVLTVVALLDLAFTRWEFGRRMMMSRRELKEEVKRREGDPAIRARLRELQQEMVRRAKSLKRVPEADVLITNPEHYAVALRYERRTMRAPCIVAKGAGDLAQRMKRVAVEHGVPLIESKALAQRLFTEGEIDQPVAAELFEPLARVYSEVYARRDAQPGLEIRR